MSTHFSAQQKIRAYEAYRRQLPPELQLSLLQKGSRSLPAWFLGPKAENADLFGQLIVTALKAQIDWRAKKVHPEDPAVITSEDKNTPAYKDAVALTGQSLHALLTRLEASSAPFFSMRHQGHMLWDMTLPSMVGYFGAMLYNQNNVAFEASPVTTELEIEVGNDLCRMLGYHVPLKDADPAAQELTPWGHIACDGSVANIESAWASRNLKYFPLTVQAALRKAPAKTPITVKLLDGQVVQLRDSKLDPWTTLNLPIDSVLGLFPQLNNVGYDMSNLNPYSIATQGFGGIYSSLLENANIGYPVMIAPATMHYSWPKAATLLGIGSGPTPPGARLSGLQPVSVDLDAHMIVSGGGDGEVSLRDVLESALAQRCPVTQVIAVIGSTTESAIDPLVEILALREEFRAKGMEFAVHADAAWGGYFASMLRDDAAMEGRAPIHAMGIGDVPSLPMSKYVQAQYHALPQVDSITVDPHKAGLVPYPAGGLCYRNSWMRSLISLSAPVVFHSQSEPTVGIYGVEGSKPGAAAAAVWLSHRVIRPSKSGYGQILGETLFTHKRFFAQIRTMTPRANDPLFCVAAVNRIPAERVGAPPVKIEEQLNLIRATFVGRSNEQIRETLRTDPELNELFRSLGSDQNIMAYAFNFGWRDASGAVQWNQDIARANTMNNDIFMELSYSHPGNEPDKNVNQVPMVVTDSAFDPTQHGPEFMKAFLQRMNITTSPPASQMPQVTYLISTQLDPWSSWIPTDPVNGFLQILEDAMRAAVVKAAKSAIAEHEAVGGLQPAGA